MNQTYSSAGQEYLYYLLRTPQLKDAKALDAMEEKLPASGSRSSCVNSCSMPICSWAEAENIPSMII